MPRRKAGTPEQHERFFRPALTGDRIGGFALSEPDGGSNVRALKTRADKVPGCWKRNGSKLYISNAPFADFLLVAARTRAELTPEAISLFIAANALGMARAAFDAAHAFAGDRIVANRRIGHYQAIAHKLADMSAQIEAARWLVYYGAWRVDQDNLDAATAARVKLVATETALSVSEQAIRIHGGAGIVREYPVGRIHREAFVS